MQRRWAAARERWTCSRKLHASGNRARYEQAAISGLTNEMTLGIMLKSNVLIAEMKHDKMLHARRLILRVTLLSKISSRDMDRELPSHT